MRQIPKKFQTDAKQIQARAYKLLGMPMPNREKIKMPLNIIKKQHIILKKMKLIQQNIYLWPLILLTGY